MEKLTENMIRIELLSETNFCLGSLDLYNRKQDVNKVYRRIDGEYVLVECRYTEDWDLNKKRSVAEKIGSDAYITYIALENDKVVGFIGLLRKLNGPYMILDMMQVSSECRGQGIGRRLFEAGKEIKYTISEDAVEGYETKVDGFNLTNVHKPSKPNKSNKPHRGGFARTGDNSNVFLWIVIMTLSIVAAIAVIFYKRKKDSN